MKIFVVGISILAAITVHYEIKELKAEITDMRDNVSAYLFDPRGSDYYASQLIREYQQ